MPLRVAEVNGWLKAVNECNQCPYSKNYPRGLCCEHTKIKQTSHEFSPVQIGFIPVWCPLPRGEKESGVITEEKFHSLLDEVINHIKTTETPKMRGKHPQNIIWDAPAIFVVEDVEIDGLGMNIMIRSELPQGPDYTCLRKDDWLRADKANYLVAESPTSPKIRISRGPKLNKGDRLIANGPAWEEKRRK